MSGDHSKTADLPRFSPFGTSVDDARRDLREAREVCPVAHSHGDPAFYTPLGYGETKSALKDWKSFASAPSIMRPVPNRPQAPPIEFDPPEHTQWRKLFQSAANISTTKRIEPLVRADARELIDGFATTGSCDLVADLAEPLPLRALCHVLGLEPAKSHEVRQMSLAFTQSFGDPEQESATFAALAEFGNAEVEARRTHPRDDLLSELAEARIGGAPLSTEQIGLFMVSFLNAGHLTTVTGLGGVLLDVLTDEALRDQLIESPERIVDAVEESLRLRPPFYGFFREAVSDTSIADVPIAAGESVYLSYAAANLDPAEFPDPEEFVLDRDGRRILTFGFGIHACPGAPIARMELRVALEELLTRLPDIRVTDPGSVTFTLAKSGTAVGIEELTAEFTPRSSPRSDSN
ncbi:cytochrome P450 [Gordonia terrae]